jgi:hemoglobin-like flavoprotein
LEDILDATQITLVQRSWSKLLPISETAAALFYNRLFETDPSTIELFKGDMKEQGVRFMQMITAAVNGLNDLDALVPAVQDLGRRHGSYGVTEAHYGSVASALLWTLEQGLGEDFTPDVKIAWTETCMLLAGVMQDAANKLEKAA